MEDRLTLDREKVDAAIVSVCEMMRALHLNVLEQWWVSYHVEIAARQQVGPDAVDEIKSILKVYDSSANDPANVR